MLNALKAIFTIELFIPHGHCYLWKPGLVGLHVTTDVLIAIAYYSISLTLFYFVRQRPDLRFKWIFVVFAAFIVSCGTTHLLEVWTLWYPTYWLSGGMKAITALISVLAVIKLIPLIPQVLALPSWSDLQQLNEELQISQARVTGILSIASDAIISIDANQRITLFNRAAEKVFGYTADEAIGQSLEMLFPQRFVPLCCHYVSNFQEEPGNPRRVGDRSEIFGRRKDGTEFPAEASISELEVSGEKVFTAFLRDITERKQAEAKLQEQQQFLRQVIDTNPSLIFVKDWDSKFILANQAVAELYGTTVENLIGKTDADFTSNSTEAEAYVNADRQVMQTLQPVFNLEETCTTSAGTIRCLQTTKKPLLSPDGKTRYVLGVANDITLLKQAEEKLRQSENTKRAMIQAIPDLLIRMRDDGTHLEVINRGSVHLVGTEDQLASNHITDVLPLSVARGRLHCARKALTTGEVQLHEYQLTIDGQPYYEEARVVPLQANEVLVMVRDISDRKQMEQDLRNSEIRFRSLIENLQVGVIVHGAQAEILLCNSKALELLGLSEAQCLGRTSVDPDWNVIREDGTPFPGQYHPSVQAIATGYSIRNVIMGVYRPQQGDRIWLLVNAEPQLNEAGKVQEVICTFSDISDRQSALRERKRAEERLRLVLKAAKFGTWECDFSTGHLLQNDMSEIYGLAPGQTHKTYEEWKAQVHPDDRDWMQAEFDRAIQKAGEFSLEFRIVRPDETVRWTLIIGTVVHASAGQPLYAYGIAADITDRKLVEVEQKAQKDFLRQVIDVVPNNIFVKNREGQLLVVNQASAAIHGTTVEAMIGKRETDFNPNFTPEQLKEFLTVNQQVMQTRQPHIDLAQVIMSATGETRWYQTIVSPLTNINDEVIGVVGATTDVTTLKQIEQALQQAKEAAEAANTAKSIFLANISHELRTPLNVILGFAQVMQRDPLLSPEQRENLQIIRRSGDHLLGLINNVLDLSKIESGRITLDESGVDLIDLVRSLEQMFAHRAEAKGLRLSVEFTADLPQYMTLDANKLRQVLINLLSNAIKFTEKGHVKLFVSGMDSRSSGLHTQPLDPRSTDDQRQLKDRPLLLHFEVTDTGIGIAPSELETIFSAFVQTQAGKISPDGTGLGLTISRRFVQLMGGDITVQSTPGQGSTFAFTVPVHQTHSAETSLTASSCQVIRLAPNQPTYRILVVDDQPENRRLLVRLLTQIGLDVREAANGQEAVMQWQHWQPHLIYMDIRMPLMNGYEATQQIRATTLDAQAPIIIALTAQASRSDRSLALSSGCNDYLSKPFQEEVLFNKMAEHLGLEYLCAMEQTTIQNEAAQSLSPSDLYVMPSSWIAELRHAAQLCDDNGIENLIEQIPAEHAFLSKGLHQLVRSYSFKQIVVLTTSGASHGDA